MRVMLDTNVLVSALLFPSERMNRISAMISNTDVLITGDKDFADVKVDGMLICTPADFLERYCTECGFDTTK